MNRARVRSQEKRGIPWWVFALIVVPPMAWAGYEWYAHCGLTRWLSERQLELLGAWYPGLTFLVVGTIFGSIVSAVVTPVLRHWMKQKRGKGSEAQMPSAADSTKSADAARFVPVLAGVTIAAVFMIPGAYFWISAARMGPLIHVDVVALEKGQAPAGGTESVFAANGLIVAHPHWVVEQGKSPEHNRTIGMTFVFNAIPLGLGVWFLVRWLTRRRRSGLSAHV